MGASSGSSSSGLGRSPAHTCWPRWVTLVGTLGGEGSPGREGRRCWVTSSYWWYNLPIRKPSLGGTGWRAECRPPTPSLPQLRLPGSPRPPQRRRKHHGRWPDWERGEMLMPARAGDKHQGPHALPRLLQLLLVPRERPPCLAQRLPLLRALGSACGCPPASGTLPFPPGSHLNTEEVAAPGRWKPSTPHHPPLSPRKHCWGDKAQWALLPRQWLQPHMC